MTEKTATKPFGVGAILTITGEALMCDIGEVYQLLGWMTGESLMTHQLPRASRECEGFLRETFPDLAATEIPDWGETPGWADLDHAGMLERITSWLATLPGESTREVPRLPEGDHTRIDPFSELRMMRPDLPIVVVETGGDS
jgi:hypothetical protein